MKKVNDVDILQIKQKLDVSFIPSPSQRACKARFWKRMDFDPDMASNITLAGAIQLTKNGELNRWWNQEGFQDWFLNKEEEGERIQYLYMLWMDKAEDLLLDPMANHNAVVQLGKIIAQLAGKDNQEKFADEFIAKMNPKQLREYIEKRTPKLLRQSTDTVETETIKDDESNGSDK